MDISRSVHCGSECDQQDLALSIELGFVVNIKGGNYSIVGVCVAIVMLNTLYTHKMMHV